MHSGNKSAQNSPQKAPKMLQNNQQLDLSQSQQTGTNMHQQQMYKQFLEGIKIPDNAMNNSGAVN